jgi:hypothetical protein
LNSETLHPDKHNRGLLKKFKKLAKDNFVLSLLIYDKRLSSNPEINLRKQKAMTDLQSTKQHASKAVVLEKEVSNLSSNLQVCFFVIQVFAVFTLSSQIRLYVIISLHQAHSHGDGPSRFCPHQVEGASP